MAKPHRDGSGNAVHFGGAADVSQSEGSATSTHLGGAAVTVKTTIRLGSGTGAMDADPEIDDCPAAFLPPLAVRPPVAFVTAVPVRVS